MSWARTKPNLNSALLTYRLRTSVELIVSTARMAFQQTQAPLEPALVTLKSNLNLMSSAERYWFKNAGCWLIIRENRVLRLAVVEGDAGFGDLQTNKSACHRFLPVGKLSVRVRLTLIMSCAEISLLQTCPEFEISNDVEGVHLDLLCLRSCPS